MPLASSRRLLGLTLASATALALNAPAADQIPHELRRLVRTPASGALGAGRRLQAGAQVNDTSTSEDPPAVASPTVATAADDPEHEGVEVNVIVGIVFGAFSIVIIVCTLALCAGMWVQSRAEQAQALGEPPFCGPLAAWRHAASRRAKGDSYSFGVEAEQADGACGGGSAACACGRAGAQPQREQPHPRPQPPEHDGVPLSVIEICVGAPPAGEEATGRWAADGGRAAARGTCGREDGEPANGREPADGQRPLVGTSAPCQPAAAQVPRAGVLPAGERRTPQRAVRGLSAPTDVRASPDPNGGHASDASDEPAACSALPTRQPSADTASGIAAAGGERRKDRTSILAHAAAAAAAAANGASGTPSAAAAAPRSSTRFPAPQPESPVLVSESPVLVSNSPVPVSTVVDSASSADETEALTRAGLANATETTYL